MNSRLLSLFQSWRTLAAGVAVTAALAPAVHADLKVGTLHPSLSDLARQVGGDKVQIVALMKPGADPHGFSPKPEDLKKLKGVPLILASGKQLETFLPKLRDNLAESQVILQVGESIPSLSPKQSAALLLEPAEEEHDHDHDHDAEGHDHHHHHGALDPHWWNSVENVQRAAGIVASAFAKLDKENAAVYKANASAYSKRLDDLRKWAKKEIGQIPKERRKLATAHLSLTYFAKEFGFKVLAVQGLSPEHKPTSKDLAAAIVKIKKHGIPAIFPEQGVNPKQVEEMIRETGAKKGGELIADGNGTGEMEKFENAFRHNVTTIVAALK